jgi:hypothetical protein
MKIITFEWYYRFYVRKGGKKVMNSFTLMNYDNEKKGDWQEYD